MNYEAAISMVKQRMREIGKEPSEYHMDIVFVVGTPQERTAGRIQIKAHNQYYYLLNWDWYYGFEISSDSGYFNLSDFSQNTIEEFTGVITLKRNQPWWSIGDETSSFPVQFLKVTVF